MYYFPHSSPFLIDWKKKVWVLLVFTPKLCIQSNLFLKQSAVVHSSFTLWTGLESKVWFCSHYIYQTFFFFAMNVLLATNARISAYLQEIVSIYPVLSPPTLTPGASNRVCNALALLQVSCLLYNLEILFPFLMLSCSSKYCGAREKKEKRKPNEEMLQCFI